MIKSLLTVTVAALALAACDNSDHTIVGAKPGGDDNTAAPATPVVLPPAIAASKIYRCKDNSVLYIDWLSDGTARAKTDKAAIAAAVADGELKGTKDDASVTYQGKACKA